MATGPWSVKGIDQRTRDAAKAAAQREGLTLGEWMNRRLMGEMSPQTPAPHPRDQMYERARFTAPGALSILSSNATFPDTSSAIEDLAARLETAERRSTLAITGIDQSVLGLLTRLEGVEKTQGEATGQLKDQLTRLASMVERSSTDLDRTVSKIDRSAEDSARRIDTVAEHTEVQLGRARHELSKELELVNSRSDELSQRLGAAERMTDNAVRTLEASFTAVDDRLRHAEKNIENDGAQGLSDMFSKRFKVLSEELVRVVAQTRGQIAAQIDAQSAEPRFEHFEVSMRDMRSHIARTERRHADTLERIASEVGKLGGAVEHRIAGTEQRSAASLDTMLDARFRAFQNDHAAAIDKIGDGLTGAISRLENKFNVVEEQRSAEDNLGARIVASEERTAKMIEDAMTRINERLDVSTVQAQSADSPVQKALTALADRLESLEGKIDNPASFDPSVSLEEPAAAFEETLRPPSFDGGHMPPSLPPLSPEIDDEDNAALGGHYSGEGADEAVIMPAYAPPAEAAPQLRTGATADADFMASARRTVRVPGRAVPAYEGQTMAGVAHPADLNDPVERRATSRKILMMVSIIALVAIVGAGSVTFFDFGKNGSEPKPITTANTNWNALIDGTGATRDNISSVERQLPPENKQKDNVLEPELAGGNTLSASSQNFAQTVSAAETVKPSPRPEVAVSTRSSASEARQYAKNIPAAIPQSKPSIPVSTKPLVVVSVPTVSSPNNTANAAPVKRQSGRLSIQQAAINGDPVAQFQLASAKLDAGDVEAGITLMRKAANRGLPIAQYHLGKLYEDGTGVAQDDREAQRWTERAANGGNRRAMHNLAMMYAEGQSVTQSYDEAAKWFQEGARMGLTNSQYNLAFLYEQGLGVPESLADAFAWYSIAANAGDDGAKDRANEISLTLSAKARTDANALIANFRPRPLDLAANGVFRNVTWARPQLNTAPSIARAQVLLARLGYNPGPADGNPGVATKKAIIAYERDQGLAQSGRIDAALLARLENTVTN